MSKNNISEFIENGQAVIGIEFGSTRIKTVLIGEGNKPIATGGYTWDNQLVDGYWTYSLPNILIGLQNSYHSMKVSVKDMYGVTVTKVKAIGISAMMHGYMAFDSNNNLLVPFRTWRNVRQAEASTELTKLFNFHIPQRWTVAHLYQAILNKEEHVGKISRLTTLSGYVHYMLSGQNVLGVGDASGIFPLNNGTKKYDEKKLLIFDNLLEINNINYKFEDIIPEIATAGEYAGALSRTGAKLLDVDGDILSGIPLCPPEGDAETGMTATNCIKKNTGNISAGTSAFAMIVLNKPLDKAYSEIDVVATPDGQPVAMAHCNNCTTDINAWIKLFEESAILLGAKFDKDTLYEKIFETADLGDDNCGNIMPYNYYSGEHISGFEEGRPLLIRTSQSVFNLANFMKANLYSAVAVLRMGMEILDKEKTKIDCLVGHGGFFKTKDIGAKIMANALKTSVSVYDTANEGGAWGIALLASYMANKKNGQSLDDFLSKEVFSNEKYKTYVPDKKEMENFDRFLVRYKRALKVERAAVEYYK